MPDGTELGRHHGLMYYTLGQRQGLGIGGRQDASDEPWYVVDKLAKENALIVDQGDTDLLLSESLIAKSASWIGTAPAEIAKGYRCSAKVRYRQRDQPCRVMQTVPDETLLVQFDTPQRAVAPGQYVVFYTGEICLGGAVIDQINRIDRSGSAIMRPPDGLAGHG
jgi:tRNA-specific 2-thiouridylase